MLALSHTVVRKSRLFRPSHIQFPVRLSTIKCLQRSCMSAARPATTFHEQNKRRKLNTLSPSRTQFLTNSAGNMAPMIQELADESASTPVPRRSLELTPVESTLRRLLLDVATHIDDSPYKSDIVDAHAKVAPTLANERLCLRFTGGWVRDKLLGVPSHDIDVAINKMTGYAFGLMMKEYLEIPGSAEKYGLEGVASTDKSDAKAGTSDKSKTVGGLHKIEANPEKSKHLETVTTRILGLDVDLVNLRKETYTDDSRNPQMEFGTPEEDALRRDATVNAMFYNLNTQEIEDFTGRGYEDMSAKLIRTPLEPWQTFSDDPLRVLRLIRFASRLGYMIDQDAQMAMRDAAIRDALKRKISRERVGVEVEKSFRGPDPHEALRLIFELGLYETVFCDPTVQPEDSYAPEIDGWDRVIDFLESVSNSGGDLADILVCDSEDRFLAWSLAALSPYNDAPLPEPPAPGRKPPPPVAAAIAREGIKATNKVCDVVTASVLNQVEITDAVDKLDAQRRRERRVQVSGTDRSEETDAGARDVLGMAIRRWGPSWRSQVMYAMLVEVAKGDEGVEGVEHKYTTFVQHLRALDILEAHTFKPLMGGKALAKALNTPPGPWMKDALDVVMAYQLRNHDTATLDSAIEEVRVQHEKSKTAGGKPVSDTNGHPKQAQQGEVAQPKKRGELTSSLVSHFLSLTIRPLFIKAKPSSVTDTGRKNTTPVLPKKLSAMQTDEESGRPWKSDRNAFALDLLRWCVQVLDERTVEQNWHLVVPPLLTLVDDHEIQYKTLGVSLVRHVLEVTPAALLSKTGLGEVFDDAIMPGLTYLPTITPVDDSLALLREVYPALIALARVRYQTLPAIESTKSQRTRYLDGIVRKGIIYGYTHCSTYPRIVSMLLDQLSSLLNELGIESIKHLQYLLPIITETLSQPLVLPASSGEAAAVQIHAIISATKALQAVIANGWPRMGIWRGEVLRGLCFGWVNVGGTEQQEKVELEDLKREMRGCVRMLNAALSGVQNVSWDEEVRSLIDAEPKVEGLLLD